MLATLISKGSARNSTRDKNFHDAAVLTLINFISIFEFSFAINCAALVLDLNANLFATSLKYFDSAFEPRLEFLLKLSEILTNPSFLVPASPPERLASQLSSPALPDFSAR